MKFPHLTSLLALPSLATAQFKLGSITTTGPGCPSGSVAIAPDRAGTDFLVLFDAFTMQLPGTGTKDCAVHINVLGVPKGQVPVFTVTARGFLAIPGGATAMYRALGFWDHDATSTLFTASKSINGDLTDNAFQLGPMQLENSNGKNACGVQGDTFHLNFAVILTGDNSLAHVDNLDIGVALVSC